MDEYNIMENLGSGGYASVRIALHKKSGFQVAVKIYEKFKLIDT
jgi:serine/threonine protein kinase